MISVARRAQCQRSASRLIAFLPPRRVIVLGEVSALTILLVVLNGERYPSSYAYRVLFSIGVFAKGAYRQAPAASMTRLFPMPRSVPRPSLQGK
jgi:hypothetical protein